MAKSEPPAQTQEKTDRPVRVSVSFDATDYAQIKDIARYKRVSTAWVVRDAVASYLDARAPLLARDRRGNE